MAAVDLITIGKLKIIVVDADPSVSGISANVGSLAMLNTTGLLFQKIGATDTDWTDTIETQTLAQTLTQGNVANTDIDMDGNDVVDPTVVGSPVGHYLGFIGGAYTVITTDAEGYATPFLYLEPGAEASLGYDTTKGFQSKPTETNVKDTALVNLDSPDVRLPQETASLILYTDASKNIKGLSTVTYPSLAELANLKGVNSPLQTQIDGKQPLDTQLTEIAALNPANDDIIQEKAGVLTNRTMAQLSADLTANLLIGYQGFLAQGGLEPPTNPADSTTYFFGGRESQAVTVNSSVRRILLPTGTIYKIILWKRVGVLVGSSENSTLDFRMNDTTDTSLSTTLKFDTSDEIIVYSGLSIAVIDGDYGEFKWGTPGWVINPLGVSFEAIILIK